MRLAMFRTCASFDKNGENGVHRFEMSFDLEHSEHPDVLIEQFRVFLGPEGIPCTLVSCFDV